ncbi:unnamed protein product [Bursaphelenchus xylophilus]|uniref:(pine wood nematode) hypothetical protein n=1 Tax=Bursaphelenchus xylophilus TaxID=6326 RepID=A0A1I7S831_BURXY|nr:unnamed protein product [Bursaphelenchus xylophilus]CAG9080643.1 unnamed protein product [Bursaphelenchus xylophilus]
MFFPTAILLLAVCLSAEVIELWNYRASGAQTWRRQAERDFNTQNFHSELYFYKFHPTFGISHRFPGPTNRTGPHIITMSGTMGPCNCWRTVHHCPVPPSRTNRLFTVDIVYNSTTVWARSGNPRVVRYTKIKVDGTWGQTNSSIAPAL